MLLGKDTGDTGLTREHPWGSVTSIKLQSNFLEVTLRHGCSAVNLMQISRTPVPENSSEGLLLYYCC